MIELSITLYAITLGSTLAMSALFVAWWVRIGKVSYMVKVVLGIMISISIREIAALNVVLSKYAGDFQRVREIITSWWWPLREIPLTVFCVIFLVHMIWRFSHMDKQGRVMYGRRYDD